MGSKRKLSHLGVGPDSDNRGADAAGDNETEQLQTQVGVPHLF